MILELNRSPAPGRKRLILHIGRHKSGTSSIQHFLAARPEALKELGAIYPRTGRQLPNKPAGRLAPAHHSLPSLYLREQCDAASRSTIKAEFDAECRGFETVIISSEGFQNLTDTRLLREFFSEYSIEVIGYIREYLEYIVSAYAQKIHANPTTIDFEAFALQYNIKLDNFFDLWKSIDPNARFSLFDRSTLLKNDIVADFLDKAGLASLQPEQLDANPSISGNLLHFKLLANMFRLQAPGHYNALAGLAAAHPQFRGKFQVPDQLQTKLRTSPYNRILANAVNAEPRLHDFRSEAPVPNFETWDEDLSIIAADPALGQVAQQLRRLIAPS